MFHRIALPASKIIKLATVTNLWTNKNIRLSTQNSQKTLRRSFTSRQSSVVIYIKETERLEKYQIIAEAISPNLMF